MVRLAQCNEHKVLSFYDLFFGREKAVWTRDVDHHAPQWLLDGLSARTGVPMPRLEALTLRSFEGFAYEALNAKGSTRWTMSVGVYHRERRLFGQQVCPCCLAEDEVPYLRLGWRLALATVCTLHKVHLVDRCGACAKPFALHRQDIGRTRRPVQRGWSHCLRCGHDLTTDVTASPGVEVEMQRDFDQILGQGHGRVGNEDVYSHLYFEGLGALVRGLERARQRGTLPAVEAEPPRSRATRLLAAHELVQQWPNRLLEFCSGIRRPYSLFIKDQPKLPYWLYSVLRGELSVISAPLLADEVDAIRGYVERRQVTVSSKTISTVSGRDVSRRSRYRRVGCDVGERLLASIDHRISEAEGTDRLVLLRDKVLITVGRCLALGLDGLSRLEVETYVNEFGPVSFWDGIDTRQDARNLLGWYARRVRPQWPHRLKTNAVFTTVAGNRMSTQAIGARFAMAVQQGMLTASVPHWRGWANPTRKHRLADAVQLA